MEIFEKASRLKLRFSTSQGHLTTEDLWDLSLEDLDTIAKRTNAQLRDEVEESFIPDVESKKKTSYNDLRLEILKHIILAKVAEKNAKKDRAAMLQQLAHLKELAASKKSEQLASQSLEDISKQIEELEKAYGETALVR